MGGKVYGIDLGTTNSAIAVVDGDDVRIVKNSDGEETTPSVIFFTDGVNSAGEDEVIVGIQAKNSAAMAPDNVVQFVKREMGSSYRFMSPSGKGYSPEALSAYILRKVWQGVEQYEGETTERDVVITVPAYFDDARRIATRQAGKIAGLNVLRVLNEPTAAAIAFGLERGQDGRVLVYDLGGGTFDVTVMKLDIRDDNKDFDVIATGGDSELGGVDFDKVIVGIIRDQLKAQGCEIAIEDDEMNADIREKAEKAKIRLSSVMDSRIPFAVNGKTYRVEISRDDFEKGSESLMQRVQFKLEEVLKSANLGWNDIDHVLAVGGSSRMPMVKKQLESLSGKSVTFKVDPDTAVARGAAIFASTLVDSGEVTDGTENAHPVLGIGAGLNISDVTSQSLGVIAIDGTDGKTEINTIIIPHNSKIPTKRSECFETIMDNQTRLHIRVTEGEDTEVRYVRIIGSSTLEIPAYPKGAPVEITYAYDPDQTICVEVNDLTAHRSLGMFQIERDANLSDDQVALAQRSVGNATID